MYEYPDDKVLERGIREQGLSWVARQLGISRSGLQSHCAQRGIPTAKDPVKLKASGLQRLAKMVG